MDAEFVTRYELDERIKRIDDENVRQNRRIDKLETMAEQLSKVASSIEAMVVSMQGMQKELEKQGKRLEDIEKKPAENWDKLVYSIVALVATAAVTWLVAKGGL